MAAAKLTFLLELANFPVRKHVYKSHGIGAIIRAMRAALLFCFRFPFSSERSRGGPRPLVDSFYKAARHWEEIGRGAAADQWEAATRKRR